MFLGNREKLGGAKWCVHVLFLCIFEVIYPLLSFKTMLPPAALGTNKDTGAAKQNRHIQSLTVNMKM